jgi:hypothetical protein
MAGRQNRRQDLDAVSLPERSYEAHSGAAEVEPAAVSMPVYSGTVSP